MLAEIHPAGYITVIVIQQSTIVGLFWGVLRLLQKLERLRRSEKIRMVVANTDLSLGGGRRNANSQPVEPRFASVPGLAAERDAARAC